MDLGKAIRLARGKAYTQKEIAEKTGVTASYISLIENNRRECSLAWLKRYSSLVNLPVSVLFVIGEEYSDITQDYADGYMMVKPILDECVNQIFSLDMRFDGFR